MFSFSYRKQCYEKKRKQLINFDYQNETEILFARAIITSTPRASFVFYRVLV